MKKKVLATICILAMTATLAACNKNNVEPTTSSEVTTTPTEATVEGSDYVDDVPVTDGDFVYKNENKTEIIGLSEDGQKTMDLVFPERVTKISNIYISSESLIQTVYFMNLEVELENVSFANSGVETIENLPTTLTTIPDNFLNGCYRLKTVGDTAGVITIPDYITEIGSGAFSGCTSITTVNLNNVTSIGDYAFQGCEKLTSITWDKAETIGNGAFFGTGFTELTLPDSVTEIGGLSFFRCANLTTIDINNVETVGEKSFDGCTALTDFTANKDFNVVNPETEAEAFDSLFDESATITLHIQKNSAYAEFLNNNPNSNFTVVY